jgi:hypothetical protein
MRQYEHDDAAPALKEWILQQTGTHLLLSLTNNQDVYHTPAGKA